MGYMKSKIWQQLSISDIVLLVLCLAAMLYSFHYPKKRESERRVYIYKENHLWNDFDLGTNRTIRIDEHNTVQIKDSRVRMAFADCHDKRCVKMSWVENVPIICLPNQVMVEIKSSETERKFILH